MILAYAVGAFVLFALSGVPSAFMPKAPVPGQRIATGSMVAGALSGLNACRMLLLPGASPVSGRSNGFVDTGFFPWQAAGDSLVGMDALSAFFLVPIFVVASLGSVYGLTYWNAGTRPGSARKLQFFWGTISAGMVLLVIARDARAFILGWELMALSAFFLVTTEDEKTESRRAGLVYLIATHFSTLTLFCLFAYWRSVTGSFTLEAIPAGAVGGAASSVLFLLALVGFGLKSGIMPLHFWLPAAHANAPSHVSALLSGVLLKMGVYGLLRICLLLPDPPLIWGGLILLSGAVSGLAGVLFALGQHDLKRLLAYHSVENIGIIFMGLGMAMMGRSAGRPSWVVLGMAACLLHVWNHSLFKSLLFLAAGSVLHATGTRRIDALGGLSKRMPWTAAFFLVGAVAICGLPPLNGFISELFVYLGLVGAFAGSGFSQALSTSAPSIAASALAVPALAMIGALALACFVKAYGSVFLGLPRTALADSASEASFEMLAPMALLSAACVSIGLFPAFVGPVLDRAIASGFPGYQGGSLPALGTFLHLGTVGIVSAILLSGISASLVVLFIWSKRRKEVPTWDCGYYLPTSRMQYTASSFAQGLVGIFAWLLHPKQHGARVAGVFPAPSAMSSHIGDLVLDGMLFPFLRKAELRTRWIHRFQQGLVQNYILYILVFLALCFCTLIPFGEIAKLLNLR